MAKIFDCFTFFNELELLEIRLHELDPVVDFFVIAESPITFRGDRKPLFFRDNQDRYSKFSSKIIHIVVDDMPITDSPWVREDFQRNSLRKGFASASPDDVICISDVDEILRADVVEQLRDLQGFRLLRTRMFQYYLNLVADERWDRPFAFNFGSLDRVPDFNRPRANPHLFLESVKDIGGLVSDAGWHFTYLGGAARVRGKLSAYSHTGGIYEKMVQSGQAERVIEEGLIVGGSKVARFVQIDCSFPSYIQGNIQRFANMGFIVSPEERVRDLELSINRLLAESAQSDARYTRFVKQAAALFSKGHSLLSEFHDFSFEVALDGNKNLLAGSSGFTGSWNIGTQAVRPTVSAEPNPYLQDHVVLKHTRKRRVNGDDNVGWWSISDIRAGIPYTASCWIRVPGSFVGQRVAIYAEGAEFVGGHSAADLLKRGAWQRLILIVRGKSERSQINLILRVQAEDDCYVESTCWQFQLGERPSQYQSS